MSKAEELERKYALLFPHLNERQQHLIAAFDGQRLGRGGITIVSRVTGFSRPTIYRAIESLSQRPLPVERVRHSGAGRKTLVHHDPQLVQALEALVDPDTRGDPMSPLRWTCKSTRVLARLLTAQGHPVSYMTVAQLLHDLHYSLQGNAKTKEGKQHPDRDAQFRYIQRQGESFLSRGWPVISVDTKKKELIGNHEKSGQEWQPEGQPIEVDVHDFPDPDIPKAVPRGVYDQQRNEGWVTVGCSHDTSSFAVESIRRWWREMGHPLYPEAEEVLVCADSGGSNGYRLRLWKVELQHWANEAGLDVTVCHYPPGTSKWNKIEHRLFSEITKNWRGRPLESYQVVVNLIGAATTETGLRVRADFDREFYPTSAVYLRVAGANNSIVRDARVFLASPWSRRRLIMGPYSMDLRERVAAAIDEGEGSERQIAKRFRVSVSFVTRLLQRRRDAGTLAPKPHGGGPRPVLGFPEQVRLAMLIAEHPDATLNQLKEWGGFACTLTTLWRTLRRFRLTYKKKTLHAGERDTPEVQAKRRRYRAKVRRIEAKRLVFVDETGVNTAMTPTHAWARRGERAEGSVPSAWGSTTVIAALGLDGVRAPLIFPGATDTQAFQTYVDQVLVPELRPGDVVVFDNLKPHLSRHVAESIERAGATVLPLPPYSSDYDPIEELWSKFKGQLRRIAARTKDGLYKAVGETLDSVTIQDILGWFNHSGLYATHG